MSGLTLLLNPPTKTAVQSLFSNAAIPILGPEFGETIPISAAIVDAITTNIPGSSQIWTPRNLTGYTIVAGIGIPQQLPVAGTYTLTYEASDTTTETTAALPYNATAAQIATALNAGAKMTAAGGCTVSGSNGFFFVTFNTPSVQNQFTSNATDLVPLTVVSTGILIQGSASPAVQCVQSIQTFQNPGAYAALSTASAAAAVTVTELVAGGGGANARYQVAFNQPAYGGVWALTLAGLETALLQFNCSASDIVTALQNLQQTSGLLIVGRRYVISNFVTSDDFTNVGALSNATGVVFVATGTTPTNWAHGSTLTPVGAGNVTCSQNSDGSFVIGFQSAMANVDMGTMTGDATSLEVIQYLSGNLSLATTAMQLLLGTQSQINCIFEVWITPSGGNPQCAYRTPVDVTSAIINPNSTTAVPLATFYTQAQVDALFAAFPGQGNIATVGTLTSGKASTGFDIGGVTMQLGSDATGDIYYANSSKVLTRLALPGNGYILISAGGLPSWSNSPTLSGVTLTSPTVNGSLGSVATLASASTVNIGAATANAINITGTATITAFDTILAGTQRVVTFSGALTLTHNATSLILPNNGGNITTAAGDTATFISLGGGNWRCVSYAGNIGYFSTVNTQFCNASFVNGYAGTFNTCTANGFYATLGSGIFIASGSNAKAGTFTLVAGAASVANTNITANSVIQVTLKTLGGTRTGNPDIVPAAGTGFVATGGALDTSTYNYTILEVN